MTTLLTIAWSLLVLVLTFYAMHRITDSYFVQSLELLSARLRLTSDVAGASLMAMGSSAPELFTSLLALVKGMELAELGAGTIVGSALFNILVIVGGTALLGSAALTWQPAVRDIVFYLVSILLLFLVFVDGVVTLGESLLFVGFYGVYLVALPLWRRIFPYEDQVDNLAAVTVEEDYEELAAVPWHWRWAVPIDWAFRKLMPDLDRSPERYLWAFLLSVAVICALSWMLVEAGVVLAGAVGVPEAIIGLTVLAVGTSIPDLLSSLVVARQGKGDMALSNAVGSNIFDILVGLGVVWMFVILFKGETIRINQEELDGSISILLGSVAVLLVLFLLQRWRIGPRAGVLLISIYGLYVAAVIGGMI
jgi:K+-dependent Na+/Ca+ exchanger-like protein